MFFLRKGNEKGDLQMIAHCLFEQSGTFKNEFRKLGYEAYDYDIQNEFGETDHVIDLFAEIEGGYEGKPSIFDNISTDDLIMAFFPCIRFENQIMLWFRGQSHSQRDWSMEKKMLFDMDLLDEVSKMYKLVNKLFILCMRRGLRLVMENPFSEEHFLRRYWCYLPAIIDKDRRDNGDYFKKPTQYWFLNCEPKQNILFEFIEDVSINTPWEFRTMEDYGMTGGKNVKTARSMIHPQYANRFIRQYLIDEKGE